MTKVLITGGLGYIGSRIAVSLANSNGYQVSITTRKKPAETVAYKIPGSIQVIHEATVESESMQHAVSASDVVIHLAAINEIDSVKNPAESLKVNVLDSYKVLEQAIQHSVKRFIYFSTAHIYGAPLVGTITENTIPRPVHPYAVTHRAFEDFVTAASDSKKISSVVLRLSNSFGPPAFNSADRWTLLVNDLCRQASTSGTMTLKTPGLQQRDFITLKDVCSAVKHCMELPAEKLQEGIFNLGGNTSMSILDMAKLVQERFKRVTGKEAALSAPAPTETDLSQDHKLHFDISKLLSTGFSLENDINSEIDETITFCTQYFK